VIFSGSPNYFLGNRISNKLNEDSYQYIVTFFIFILTSLFLSIRNYLIYKNFYQLVALLYVITTLIPFLPSGSFFSTYASSLFWVNYAIMISYNKKLNLKF